MKKDQVISRLCGLIRKVGSDVFGSRESMDCICGCNPLIDESDQRAKAVVDDKIIEFIEEAVLRAVNEKRVGGSQFALLTAVAAEILKGAGFRRHEDEKCNGSDLRGIPQKIEETKNE